MADDVSDCSGKAVPVSGGNTGIGRATALTFGRHGAKVGGVQAFTVDGGQAAD